MDWARATGGPVVEDDYDGESRYDRQPVGTPPEHAFSGAVARLCAVLRQAARGADPHPWHSMVIGP